MSHIHSENDYLVESKKNYFVHLNKFFFEKQKIIFWSHIYMYLQLYENIQIYIENNININQLCAVFANSWHDARIKQHEI